MANNPQGSAEQTPLLIICPFCQRTVIAIELAKTEWIGEDQEPPLEIYSFLECASCHKPLLLREFEWGHGDPPEEPERLWPPPPRTISSAIPDSLRQEVAEARTCFDAKAYTATVVMVRRTLEAVCADHKVTKKPLQNALKEMAVQGLLDSRLLTWADELRVLGNQGAHYTGSPVNREDAKDALALAEAVLDYLYVLAKQFYDFKRRRAHPGSCSSM
jgi:Domain of unknown function (DUF4145)